MRTLLCHHESGSMSTAPTVPVCECEHTSRRATMLVRRQHHASCSELDDGMTRGEETRLEDEEELIDTDHHTTTLCMNQLQEIVLACVENADHVVDGRVLTLESSSVAGHAMLYPNKQPRIVSCSM
jgi:hypothetical protein